MTLGSGKPWSANCWHIWDKDHAGCCRIYTLSHCCPLAGMLEINEVDWYGKSFLCHVLLCVVQAYVLRGLFSFKYHTKILYKTTNIIDFTPPNYTTFMSTCVCSEVSEVVTDCFVFPLQFGSFPAAVTITAEGLIWCAHAEKWPYNSKLRGCSEGQN